MKTIWIDITHLCQLSGEKDERGLPQLGALLEVVEKNSPFFGLRGYKQGDSQSGKSLELSVQDMAN